MIRRSLKKAVSFVKSESIPVSLAWGREEIRRQHRLLDKGNPKETAAALYIPLLRMGAAVYEKMSTFEEISVTPYVDYEGEKEIKP